MSDTDRLEDRIGEIDDAKRLADDIVAELEPGEDDDLGPALKLAREAAEALATAETVETEKDFDLNLRDAWTACVALTPALKLARDKAKKNGEDAQVDRIDEAREGLKQLVRELRDVMPENPA